MNVNCEYLKEMGGGYRPVCTRGKFTVVARCEKCDLRIKNLAKQVNRVAIIEQGLRNRGMHDMADEFADFHDVTEDAYAAFLALLESDDGE